MLPDAGIFGGSATLGAMQFGPGRAFDRQSRLKALLPAHRRGVAWWERL